MYGVQRNVYRVHCTLKSVHMQCSVYNANYKSVQVTVYSVHHQGGESSSKNTGPGGCTYGRGRGAYCTMYHCILYNLHSTQYNVHHTLYTAHCNLYTVHCDLYTVQCTVYSVSAVPCTQYTVHCTLYTVHCIQTEQ